MTESDLRLIAEEPRPGDEDASSDSLSGVTWISSVEARRIVAQAAGSRVEAEALLIEAMAGGTIYTRGVPNDVERRRAVQSSCGLSEDDDFRKIWIEASYWAGATNEDRSKWNWQSGEFVSTLPDSSLPVRYFDVEFPEFELKELCVENGLININVVGENSIETDIDKNVGGRSSGKHGQPIAEMAIKLFLMGDEFNRETGKTVSYDLKGAYKSYKIPPPSDPNLNQISWGILRAVKDARNARE